MKILVIYEDAENASIIKEALICCDYNNIILIRTKKNLYQSIMTHSPDIIIFDLHNPGKEILEAIFEVTRRIKRPIVMFVNKSDVEATQRAIQSGVSAYIVDGLKKDRVSAIIEVAISRFESFRKIAEELDQARNALAERKIIEKAKGLLMASRNISEECAYKLLRNNAMKQSRKIVEIANIIISASEIDNGVLHHTDVLGD